MLLAEKRKHNAIAEKIGHEEYIYRLNGDPSQLPGAGGRSGYGYTRQDTSMYGNGGMGGGGGGGGGYLSPSLFTDHGFAAAPIIPSLAPPESLPPILPTVHYPKPPIHFHTSNHGGGGYAYGGLATRSRPLQPALPLTTSTTTYALSPSNTGISTSLPGYASLPPIRNHPFSAPPPPPQPQAYVSSYARGTGVGSGGGAATGMSGVMNWSSSPTNVYTAAQIRPATGHNLVTNMSTPSFVMPRQYAAPPAPPPGFSYDPADLPPAGKMTNRKAMPTYFTSSDVPTPSTTPRYRGSSQGLTFQTQHYTDIHR